MTTLLRLLPVAIVVALLVSAALPTGRAQAAAGPAWGLVASTCTASSLAANRAVGITVVEVEAYWDRYMPARAGAVDTAYVADLRARITRCLDAGLRVVLGPGMQYPPAWVRSLPGAALVDQRGKRPTNGAIDTVFSAAVRAAQADYLKRLVTDLPAKRIEAVRVGTSTEGEIGYPGPNEAGDGFLQSWWAFSPAAQQGTGLAAGTARSPMPGWIPGQKAWQGKAVTAAAARSWFLWYSRALTSAVKGQHDALRAAGFTGQVHLPSPGKGVLPADLTTAANALLNGTGDRDGSLGRGLNYTDQFAVLAGSTSKMVIDLSGVDDASAVLARRQSPAQDACRSSDPSTSVAAGTPVHLWSNLRFARAQATRAGLPAIGENPGPPAAQTGGTSYSDSLAEQVRRAPGYARSCGLSALLVAFEWALDDPGSGVTRDDYRRAVLG
ncbi:hypothetical protein [Actinomycetospora termitidis]|uniref:Glycoside hydrolase family 42 N-terminal domain-containing protein n=1 Tax=Actinomycetospora termitidis TaxID=3053470 RepID=A0ABT7M4T4_9PSEU|nr:hypothetical protein [Actinomycetospora sp. Odt1-22]MDL5155692.1 hypothetical protein [Actinomycetospora sp. Odt1-22]